MTIGLLLSVRNKARRLPGKVLMPFAGTSVTGFLIDRLMGIDGAACVVVATSKDSRDEVLCDIAVRHGAACFRGHPDDKLRRYRDAMIAHGLTGGIVVDGDDPFVSEVHLARLLQAFNPPETDFMTWQGLPLGATGFALSLAALERYCASTNAADTEIWGSIFVDDPAYRSVFLTEIDPRFNRPNVRMTLDYELDLEFFNMVIDGLDRVGKSATFGNVMDFLAERPDVVAINAHLGTA